MNPPSESAGGEGSLLARDKADITSLKTPMCYTSTLLYRHSMHFLNCLCYAFSTHRIWLAKKPASAIKRAKGREIRGALSYRLVQGPEPVARCQAADGWPDCSHIRREVLSPDERRAGL